MQYFAYSQKSFVYKYVVMLSDIDQFKHMSFANYLKLMFLSTDALLTSILTEAFLEKKHLKLVRSRMQFKKQTVAGDNILIKINSTDMQNDLQCSLLYTFVIENTGELVGLGKQTYEVLELVTNSKETIKNEIKLLLDPISVNEENLIYKY